MSETTVYLVYAETSDQYGTSELVGIFSTEEKARGHEITIRMRRSFIKTVTLDTILVREKFWPAEVGWP